MRFYYQFIDKLNREDMVKELGVNSIYYTNISHLKIEQESEDLFKIEFRDEIEIEKAEEFGSRFHGEMKYAMPMDIVARFDDELYIRKGTKNFHVNSDRIMRANSAEELEAIFDLFSRDFACEIVELKGDEIYFKIVFGEWW